MSSPPKGGLLAEGMNRVFDLSKMRMVDPAEADYRIVLRATLQPPRSGSQTARLDIRILDGPTGVERYAAEFKTTLSDPVDDEQLRVLGEGAAYRILIWAAGGRVARQGTRLPAVLKMSAIQPEDSGKLLLSLDGGSLRLQMDSQLSTPRMSLSRLPQQSDDAGEVIP